ncbi:MAG: hypothetical protein IKP73_08250 [Bacteroidales bacterium]|nr:hypothetical protein [Bacteroidales bacterium]MBR4626016.1 hypothetical protein [Alphaproteobacteria bacterium]
MKIRIRGREFEIFSDRLEITSYGTMPNGMTEEEFMPYFIR